METHHLHFYVTSIPKLLILSAFAVSAIAVPNVHGTLPEQTTVGIGKAAWISKSFHGLVAASGEKHNYKEHVAAHYTLPFNTVVRVTNLENGKSIFVRINDRKPYSPTNIISVSWVAAKKLNMLNKGRVKAKIEFFGKESGIASWYGVPFHGRLTANGEIYDMNKVTAAHKELPFNTRVRVINLANGKSVVVRINDRGPFVKGRIIDLSKESARRIDMIDSGISSVVLEVLPNMRLSEK